MKKLLLTAMIMALIVSCSKDTTTEPENNNNNGTTTTGTGTPPICQFTNITDGDSVVIGTYANLELKVKAGSSRVINVSYFINDQVVDVEECGGTSDTISTGVWPVSETAGIYKVKAVIRDCNNNEVTTPVINVKARSAFPSISCIKSLEFENAVTGMPSNSAGIFIKGSNLTAGLNISAPTGFEISKNGTDWSSSLTINNANKSSSNGSRETPKLYVRFKPNAAQNYFGDIVFTSVGMTTKRISVTAQGINNWVDWAKNIAGNISSGSYINKIITDGNGNNFIHGTFSGGNIAKTDANGNIIWTKQIASDPRDIAVDNSGDLYVTGQFDNTMIIESTTLTSNGSSDIYIAKFSSNGNLQWAKNVGGANDDYPRRITANNNGDIFLSGQYRGQVVIGSTTLPVPPNYHYTFIAKMDASGNFGWAKAIGINVDKRKSVKSSIGTSMITSDNSGNCFISGTFYGSLTFGSITVLSNNNSSNNSSSDLFISKIDNAGNFNWAKTVSTQSANTYSPSTPTATTVSSICTDNSGNIYLAGACGNSSTGMGETTIRTAFDNTIIKGKSGVGFVAKMNTAGNFVWAKKAGEGFKTTDGYSSGSYNATISSIKNDSQGNVYFAGGLAGSSSMNYNSISYAAFGQYKLFGTGLYIAKMNSNGDISWARQAYCESSSGYGAISGITTDNSGNPVVAGSFGQGGSTSPYSASFGSTILSGNGQNGFIVKCNSN